MNLNIEPITFPKIAVRMTIDVNVTLNEKALITVCFYEEGDVYSPLDRKVFIIQGDEYKAWGNDDNYITNIVYQKLGLHNNICNEN
jgi:hypothetical protein